MVSVFLGDLWEEAGEQASESFLFLSPLRDRVLREEPEQPREGVASFRTEGGGPAGGRSADRTGLPEPQPQLLQRDSSDHGSRLGAFHHKSLLGLGKDDGNAEGKQPLRDQT